MGTSCFTIPVTG